MEITDEKLDRYLANIKNESDSSVVLSNYEKATNRLNILKKRHNKINETVRSLGKNLDSESDDMSTDDIMGRLDQIKTELEDSNLSNIINLYTEYHKLITLLESKHDELQNQFYEVDKNKSDIVINKIDLDKFL